MFRRRLVCKTTCNSRNFQPLSSACEMRRSPLIACICMYYRRRHILITYTQCIDFIGRLVMKMFQFYFTQCVVTRKGSNSSRKPARHSTRRVDFPVRYKIYTFQTWERVHSHFSPSIILFKLKNIQSQSCRRYSLVVHLSLIHTYFTQRTGEGRTYLYCRNPTSAITDRQLYWYI